MSTSPASRCSRRTPQVRTPPSSRRPPELDANSADIAAGVGSVAPDQESRFLEQWRSHISDFVDYALAAAAGDEAGKQQQLDDLNAYRASAGQFFADITGGALAAADVAETLGHHAETLAGAIDSFSGALVDR